MSRFAEKVYQAVQRIPKGKVATYGQIASWLGSSRSARAVGNALHANHSPNVPCYRVVNSQGRLAQKFGQGGWREQKRRLLDEGVGFKDEKRVDLKKYQYRKGL